MNENNTKIHPNTPPKLVKLLRKCGSFHKAAEETRVNVWFIHKLVTQGKEPTDHTPKGREIRRRMFLPRYKRRNRARKPQTKEQKAIRQMVKETRSTLP